MGEMKHTDSLHPSHDVRESDASSFDLICTKCGATDVSGGGWGKLAHPCAKYEAIRLAKEWAEGKLGTLRAAVQLSETRAALSKAEGRSLSSASGQEGGDHG